MLTTHLGEGAAYDVALDAAGYIYVVGVTASPSFPTTPGAYQTSLGASSSAVFVVKLAPDGTVVYSTLLSGTTPRESGGNGTSVPWGVAVDASGHAVVAGTTSALDFPTTEGAAIRSTAESKSGFVTELTSDGSALVYSTLIGATEPNTGTVEGQSSVSALALDASGIAYAAGTTLSAGFPVSPGARGVSPIPAIGMEAGFLTRIGAGGGLVSSAGVADRTYSAAVQPNGQAVLGGTPGGFSRYCAPGVIDQIDASGTSMIRRWKFPPCGPDGGSGAVASLATDSSGDVYVSGWQDATQPPHQQQPYVKRLDPTLDLVSTFTVPEGALPTDLALDATGVWLAFTADGPLYPTAGGGISPPTCDQAGAYLVRLDSDDGALTFSTYVASTSRPRVATDGGKRAVVVGTESTGDFAGQAFVTVYEPVSPP